MLPLLLACASAADPAASTSRGDTGPTDTAPTDTADSAQPTDTGGTAEPLAAVALLASAGQLVDAVEGDDGALYLSVLEVGVVRWDGDDAVLVEATRPGSLAPGTGGTAYVTVEGEIVDVATGVAVDGAAPYAPGALDLFPTDAGDRLSFAGTDPESGAPAVYTVRASGGAVATVGEGYGAPLRWVFRPQGETCWATDEDGGLWLVADGEDVATLVSTGMPPGGLAGNVDGTTLYLGGGESIFAFDVATDTMLEYPADLDGNEVLSLHRTLDGVGLVVTTATTVYRVEFPPAP